MSTQILLVGHGSRESSGNHDIHEFVQLWRQRHPAWRIQTCFIEFAEPSLAHGLDSAALDASRVLVLPLILNAAGHVKMEIPQAIAEARQRHPGVRFDYAPHLGACDELLAVLKRELRRAMNHLDMPDPTTTGVVLLGRGASDRQANGEVAKMARWLQEEGDHELVDIAFTGITWPRLEKVVQRQVALGMRQVVVLPYYLFTGTLIQRIERQVEHLRLQYPQVRFAKGRHFGFEQEVFDLMSRRVQDLLDDQPEAGMPCDGCKYREIAQELGHGHSHEHTHDHAHPHALPHAHPHEDGQAPGHVQHVHDHAHHAHDHHAHDHHGHDPHGHPHPAPRAAQVQPVVLRRHGDESRDAQQARLLEAHLSPASLHDDPHGHLSRGR